MISPLKALIILFALLLAASALMCIAPPHHNQLLGIPAMAIILASFLAIAAIPQILIKQPYVPVRREQGTITHKGIGTLGSYYFMVERTHGKMHGLERIVVSEEQFMAHELKDTINLELINGKYLANETYQYREDGGLETI